VLSLRRGILSPNIWWKGRVITNFGSLYAGHVDLVWKVVDLAVVGKRLVVVAAHKGVAGQAGLPG